MLDLLLHVNPSKAGSPHSQINGVCCDWGTRQGPAVSAAATERERSCSYLRQLIRETHIAGQLFKAYS